MESSGLRQARRFCVRAMAVALGVLAAGAIAGSLRRLALAARHSAEREAELDEWAHSSFS